MSDYQFDTKCIQSGYHPGNAEPRTLPIYQSTTYKYDNADTLGQLFDLKAEAHMYCRIPHPTPAAVEEKLADLEGGVGAMLVSSGQSANLLAVFNICSAGQNLVAMNNVYGGTINLLSVTMARMGIEVRYANDRMTDEQVEALFDENTRLFFGETINNPALTVFDNVLIAKHMRAKQNVLSATFRLNHREEKRMREETAALLEEQNLLHLKDEVAGSLPYGAQRRLEIVRALATNPSLLLLDEPAAGMNPSETAELMENIVKIRDTFQIAVLLIEHDMSLVMGICEGICVLNFGEIIAKGTPEEIQNNPEVIKAYLGSGKGE